MSSLSDQEQKLVQALVQARTTGPLVDLKTVSSPADNASAMRVQSAVVNQLGEKVLGWKVGFSPAGASFAGPLIASAVFKAPARWIQKTALDFRIEIEIGVRLAKDLPARPGNPYSREEITAAIDTVFFGVELLDSRYADPSQLTFELGVADIIHNGFYALGEEKKTKDLPGPLNQLVCSATLDGVEIYKAAPKHPQDDILLPVISYANEQTDNVGGLKAGQLITTGSMCGIVASKKGGKLVASFTGFDDIVIELVRD